MITLKYATEVSKAAADARKVPWYGLPWLAFFSEEHKNRATRRHPPKAPKQRKRYGWRDVKVTIGGQEINLEGLAQ